MKTFERNVNKCNKCGWLWVQRKQVSHRCPKCHSYEWNNNDKNKFLSELEKEETTDTNKVLKKKSIEINGKKLTEDEIKQLIKSLMEMM